MAALLLNGDKGELTCVLYEFQCCKLGVNIPHLVNL